MSAADAAIIGSAALLGLAGIPHCAVMCGSACTALTRRSGCAQAAFHGGRLAAYSAAGAVAAASVGILATWAQASRGLLALWTLMHAGLFALGGFLLIAGRFPALNGLGRAAPVTARWQAMQGPGALGAGLAGLAWVAWPCATLQSALVVATLASTPLQGALTMATFALVSGGGLWIAPQLLHRVSERNALRAAGVLVLAASAWALFHDATAGAAAWCAGATS